MSVRTLSLVFEYDMPEIKTDDGKVVPDSTAKFVLLALADHANDEGEGAYPGVKRICKKTSMSSQTVCNALNALRHNEYTTLQGKSKSDTNNYTINVARFQPLESPDSSHKNSPILAARVKPSINHHKKPSIKEGAAPATPKPPRANDFPSNVLFREVTEKYPKKSNWHDVLKFMDGVSRRLGRQPTKEDLSPFYSAWTGCGWNEWSINWLEYAVKGELPKKMNGATKTSNNQAAAQRVAERFYGNQNR